MTDSHLTPSSRDSRTDPGLPLAHWPETESRLAAELREVRTLDIGCGPHKLNGAVGIDLRPLPGVDLVQDLDQHPWALPANQYDFIRCQHVIEHLSDL